MALTLRATFADVSELVRDLDAIEIGLGREISDAIAAELDPMLQSIISHTPIGPGPNPNAAPDSDAALPHMAEMYETRVDRFGAKIVSTHPAVLPTEFGGDISPRGVVIHIARHEMAQLALAENEAELTQRVSDALDRLIERVIR